MRLSTIVLISVSSLALGACAQAEARPIPYGHLHKGRPPITATPAARVAAANAAALQEPQTTAFLNAVQIYPFMEGAIYRLYAAPEKVSDIALQPGEQLIAISAGDTARWLIGDTYSGTETTKQIHILVKPYTAGLKTNLVVTTNRRTYHIQMESTQATAMTVISWSYPADDLMVLQAAQVKAQAAAPLAAGIAVEALQFRYAISGGKPAWRPVRVFDDGERVYIQFPESLAQSEAPPLFVVGTDGKAELLNYRVRKSLYVVDRLFRIAELRLGGKHQQIVRITRTDPIARVKASEPGIGGGHD
ncbi:P-type conjugative transfer protein TrbG [Asticcacaulis sp.]|uniref:P-type conjugative transfer protein TrbG n=1 Tax=Asticcacaulis sp. TaxID=1872648 RepID=UPI002C48C909|nr:P-type conjugative transfer protein TrbG [Asticcacaulis sp.]HTM81935.1 P-type conjugative transfer protein TrbG [Asticcacaulis sp.]